MFYTNEDIFNNDTPRKIFSYCTKTNVKGVITHYRLVHTGIEFMLQERKENDPNEVAPTSIPYGEKWSDCNYHETSQVMSALFEKFMLESTEVL